MSETRDEFDGDTCECGEALATHPPLPKPSPLTSWQSRRSISWAFGAVSGRRWSVAQQQAHDSWRRRRAT